MSDFIKSANLPDKKIKTVLIGHHIEIIERLNSLGIKTIVLEDNPDVDFSVRNHADMSALHLGGNSIFLDRRQVSAAEKLGAYGLSVILTEENISGAYPNDVRLNCAIVGEKLICGKKGVEPQVLDMPFEKIAVNQGYCKCSICILNEKAIITDDESIFKATKDILDVLLIEKGDIQLENKDYGFIGGAGAKLNADTIMFFGSLKYHRNGEQIKSFLSKYKMKHIELFDGKLRDIGSIIPIFEE